MPTYVYKFIDTDETIEIHQSFSDATLTEAVHPESGESKPVKKVFLPVGVTFKGDGFYKTDNRSKKKSTSSSSSDSSDSSGSSSSDSSKSSDSSPKESTSKSDTKSSDTKSNSSSAKSSD